MKKKALFIGGTGVISTAVVERLAQELNWEVWLLNRGNRKDAMPPGVHQIIADVNNEQDVADALNSGRLRAAGVDVAETEPIPAASPLLAAKNCVITPHIAWAPLEARRRLMDIAAGNLRAFLAGSPVNAVNL